MTRLFRNRLLVGQLLVGVLGVLLLAMPVQAIPGTPDKVPAASLLVPFFETGIDSGANPHDTLLVVTNERTAPAIIHYHVWNIDGTPTSIQGNHSLAALDTWTVAMRDLITPASVTARNLLDTGSFYRGFVTIDTVTANTGFNPKAAAFPFSFVNGLEGQIYYTRLSQGSANGINMIGLEAMATSVNALLRDFYTSGRREEIDATARSCANLLATSETCPAAADTSISRLHARTFGSVPLSGDTRVVIFTWNTRVANGTGGPSQICDDLGTCDENYEIHWYNEAGTDVLLPGTTIRLDHVVNIVTFNPDISGWFSVRNIPDTARELQTYVISINSANAGVALTWDAMFEGYVLP